MTTAPHSPDPQPMPQPDANPEDLRAALVALAPSLVAVFDAERAEALRESRERVSAMPLQNFTHRWAIHVAVERHPERAARLRELEARAAVVEDREEARTVASGIREILGEAAVEAGLGRDGELA